jgi:hypothetical protein
MPDDRTTNSLLQSVSDEDMISDSDLSDMFSEEEEEEEPEPVMPLPKKKNKTAAPKTTAAPKPPRKKAAATVNNGATPKIKKTRTVRRPYKSMAQDKLVAKQAVAHGRFEVVSKRMGVIQGQLLRFDHEIATRAAMLPGSSQECVEAPPVPL